MTDLTLGQRIAQRRKLLQLSQEALGEKLGVSRQAISKWEADGAVPEIDKLIAMSRLFGVSVGWLLGTEETTGAEHREAFSEAQLKMVEEIVRRYQPPERKTRNWLPWILAAAVAVCFAVGNFGSYVNSSLNALHIQIDNLYSYYSQLSGQMYNVSAKLEELAAGERLLTEYSFEAEGSADLTAATVRFVATPRVTEAGDEAWLSVRLAGEEVAKVPCALDGTAYTASVELPAVDGYSYYFQVIHATGGSSQEPLTKAYACEELATGLRGYFYANAFRTDHSDELVTVDNLELFYIEPKLLAEHDGAAIRDLTLLVSYDQESVLRIPLIRDGKPEEDKNYVTRLIDQTDFHFLLNLKFPCDWTNTEEVILSAEITLATGQVMEQPLMKWHKNGTLIQQENVAPFA